MKKLEEYQIFIKLLFKFARSAENNFKRFRQLLIYHLGFLDIFEWFRKKLSMSCLDEVVA
jgi:hypothetical protein